MRFNSLSVAIRNLHRKRFRTAILIISIAILVSLLIFAISFTISVNSGIKKASDRLGADLIIVPVGARDFAEEFLLESKNKSFYMSKGIIERVKQIDEIESVTYQTYLETIGGVCCDVTHTQVVAFDQDTDFIIKPWLKKSLGRRLSKGEAIAGYETYENLGLDLLEVEKTLFNKKFKVVGVLDKTGTGLDNALFMTEEDMEEIIEGGNSPIKKGLISIIFAKVKEGVDPYYASLLVEGEIIEVDAVARREMGGKMLKTLKDINRIFLVSIVIASFLTIFLVWAIFSAIANERSKEVGIMRAIGAKELHIVKLFLLEVVSIGILGSVVGMAGGIFLSITLTQSFAILQNVSTALSIFEQFTVAVIGLFTGICICVAGALFPINRIKKKEPFLAIMEG
jgi:putative ABC transport system permease protein